MKIKSNQWQVTGDRMKKAARQVRSGHVSRVTCHPEHGVALIVTLILLAVVTIMAITFLAVSRRERNSVSTVTDTASARFAADAALSAAEAQIMANVLANTNPYSFGLLVSTNYISGYGYNNKLGVPNVTNVSYYYPNGAPVFANTADFLQMLANLYYSPRPPVFIPTNTVGGNDFRFYLDLNRNGMDDPNGYVTNYDNLDQPVLDASRNVVTNLQVGDPEWIGLLQRPDQPYGPNNPFVARFAFIAIPIGNTLDLNAIHNQVFDENAAGLTVPVNSPSSGLDGYNRNQGVGSWEINLAAFLVDLDTNEWGQAVNDPLNLTSYYFRYPGGGNVGRAFEDARALLAYRYNNNYLSLASVNSLFGGPSFGAGYLAFSRDNIDGYSDGLLQTNTYLPGDTLFPVLNDNTALPWAGADNTNHYFSLPSEVFNPAETFSFSTNLLTIGATNWGGTAVSTYDRYTFYRMLAQLGTDSSADSGKMDLNYDNLDPYSLGKGSAFNENFTNAPAATNFMAWTPLGFFTNAADRLVRAYTAYWRASNPTNFVATFYGMTNFGPLSPLTLNPALWTNYPAFGLTATPGGPPGIPVLVSNQFVYTPAMNRLLQLAANLYDATTNNYGITDRTGFYHRYDYPSVFRPLFSRDANAVGMPGMGTNLYITGFTVVTNVNPNLPNGDPQLALPIAAADLAYTNSSLAVTNWPVNIYGVPWIIGAKKGFPNFNELAMDTAFQLTRKLMISRTSPTASINTYSNYQMFILNITNQVGVECWNSYTNAFTNQVAIYAYDYVKNVTLANDENFSTNQTLIFPTAQLVTAWAGYIPSYPSPSFQIPLNISYLTITNSIYRFNQGGGLPYLTSDLYETFETNVVGYPQPHWWLTVSNDLRVIMLDTSRGSPPYPVIDYVQLAGPNSYRDLTTEIMTNYDTGTGGNNMWATNFQNGIPAGLSDQISVSLGIYTPGLASGAWNPSDPVLRENEIDGFRAFYHLGQLYPNNPGEGATVSSAQVTNNMQAPYTPTATVVQHVSWQANDPLVHYLNNDLNWAGASRYDRYNVPLTNENLGVLNQRYQPWGRGPLQAGYYNPINLNLPFTVDQNVQNMAYKDPLVRQSDDWDFPTYKLPTVGWLGRVHRGTPWQTVYLKATNILSLVPGPTTGPISGPLTWIYWTGDMNPNDALNDAPGQDRLLFDLFTTSFNDNASRGTLSVNQDHLAAWSALFSGMIALSNNLPSNSQSFQLYPQHNGTLTNYTSFPISPAGPYYPYNPATFPALVKIVQGIDNTRATTTNVDGVVGTFEHLGSILRTPQLSDQSPFLNWNDLAQQNNGISDEMYEWLPQQALSLLRCSSAPRYVIYCYGQALKPAPNGVYLGGGPYFGMVTNYQVVSEVATRAVVQFNCMMTNTIRTNGVTIINGFPVYNWIAIPAVTNNSAVVEQFNLLPPD